MGRKDPRVDAYINEYVAWITGAKRLATAIDWLVRGRNMNWRYER